MYLVERVVMVIYSNVGNLGPREVRIGKKKLGLGLIRPREVEKWCEINPISVEDRRARF